MNSHKSAFLGLALGALVLGVSACEDKAPTVIVPPPAVEISITPASLTLEAGQTGQFSASVTGGNASTDRTVTYSSSNPNVATVSATGAVTAVAPGTSTVTANNAANGLSASAQVIVTGGGTPTEPAAPTITIKSVTTGNTLTPVNINNVRGQIDVTLNVEVPEGNTVQELRVFVTPDGGPTPANPACRQTIQPGTTSAGLALAAANAQVEIVCSIDTAEFSTVDGVTYLNGVYFIQASLVSDNSVTATAQTRLVFNNVDNFRIGTTDVVVSGATAISPIQTILPAGSAWRRGTVTVTVRPVIYTGATSAVQSLFVNMTSSGVGTAGCTAAFSGAADPTIGVRAGGVVTPPTCGPVTVTQAATLNSNGTLTATFPLTGANNIGNQEDVWAISVTGAVNAAGQAGPVCVNPDPVRNPITGFGCATGDAFPTAPATPGPGPLGFTQRLFGSPLALDNLAPRVVSFNMIAAGGNQYFNNSIAFNAVHNTTSLAGSNSNVGTAVTIDWGVDNQTAETTQFQAGVAGSLQAVAGPGALAESLTNATYTAAVLVADALGNSQLQYAHNTTPTIIRTSSAAPTVRFGVDLTAPTLDVDPDAGIVNGINNSTGAAVTAWTYTTFSDAAPVGAGPSGFPTLSARQRMQRWLASGSGCVIGTGSGCTFASVAVNPGDAVNYTGGSATQAYYRFDTFVVDAAGNPSTTESKLGLQDTNAPVVAPIGGPSTINGNTSVSFTSNMEDNVELGTIQPYVGYTQTVTGAPTFTPFTAGPMVTVGTFGEASIQNSSSGNTTFPNFIVSIETVDGGNRPSGNIAGAQTINYDVRDVASVQLNNVGDPTGACPALGTAGPLLSANTCTQRQDQIFANVTNGNPGNTAGYSASMSVTGNGPAGFTNDPYAQPTHGQFTLTSTAPVSDRSSSPSVTLTATSTGPNATFNQPWSRVEFWYQDATGLWRMVPGTTSHSAVDNTVLATRTWTHSLSWNATVLANGAYPLRAIAVTSDGRALASAAGTLTVQP